MSPRPVFREMECQLGPGGLNVLAGGGPRGAKGFLQRSSHLSSPEPQIRKEQLMKGFFSHRLYH